MKKITLLFLFLTAGYSIQAQSTSFEASEGFFLGPISGQNGWGVFGGDGANLAIDNTQASDGTFSLKLTATNAGNQTGALSPIVALSLDVVVTVDVYLESISEGILSQVHFVTQGGGFRTTEIIFFEDYVYAVDNIDGTIQPIFIDETLIRDAWFELKIEHVYSIGEMRYYINDVLVYTGSQLQMGANADQTVALFNNNLESSAIFDNIVVQDGLFLGIEENTFIENSISLYPNPTEGELNINFSKNVGTTHIHIVNITGQTVLKTVTDGFGHSIINTRKISAGVYFVQMATEFGNTSIKFIKI